VLHRLDGRALRAATIASFAALSPLLTGRALAQGNPDSSVAAPDATGSTVGGGRGKRSAADVPPDVAREFRGVWVASVSNIDWPSRPGLPVAEQKAELLAILDRTAALRMNAVILQVRPAADALYESKKEPWSGFLTGTMGKAPDPYYDPLAFAVEEAHARGLELHAWFNPYRAHHPDDTSRIAASHISRRRPDLVRKYGKYLWMDPGSAEVRKYTVDVIRDVVRRYDIDGVHIDDYFYPYRERGRDRRYIQFPDNSTWQAYRRSGGKLSRDDWRRRNVDLLVEQLYKAVKAEKPWVKFGISPFGIWRPGSPTSVRGLDAYTEIYADSRKWIQRGWLDYFAPQLYWKSYSPRQRYDDLLQWWTEQNRHDRHIWVGTYTSRVAGPGSVRWPASELLEQIRLTREQPGATGNVHFSMEVLLQNRDGVNDHLLAGPYAEPALVPASPWMDKQVPSAPRAEVKVDSASGRTTVSLMPQGMVPARLWVIRARFGTEWTTTIVPASTHEHSFAASDASVRPDLIVVTAIGRTGNESEEARVELR
jgi:uncharacterized lipoprotein YddW (UPF0748 family)